MYEHTLTHLCTEFNKLNTFSIKTLEAEASSMFLLFTESRYKTSENPLSFALLRALKTYINISKNSKQRTNFVLASVRTLIEHVKGKYLPVHNW